MKKKLVILTGAGMSQESGLKTFRDSNGLWENHKIEDVASPTGWHANPELVLEFYNQRRRQLAEVEPNEGHKLLVKLEEKYDVHIITQNIDDLHERAGSKNVLHLHGELTKARGALYKHKESPVDNVIDIGYKDINIGDKCPVNDSQLRPHIVWFGEMVPKMEEAEDIAKEADIFVIIGTSLVVYPAAGLIKWTHLNTPVYVIDPSDIKLQGRKTTTTFIKMSASAGVEKLMELLEAAEGKEETKEEGAEKPEA